MKRFGSMAKWHWVSSAVCLIGLLLFSITGITLNHAQSIEAVPQITTVELTLPEALQRSLITAATAEQNPPAELVQWLRSELGINVAKRPAEWSDVDLYISLPQPGGDAWLSIEFDSGELIYEHTWRGTIGYLNDLHKGRNTGLAWKWFLDVFAVACLIFTITGLLLLFKFAKARWSTWPLVALGALIPIVILVVQGA